MPNTRLRRTVAFAPAALNLNVRRPGSLSSRQPSFRVAHRGKGVVDIHQTLLQRRAYACPLVKPVREPVAGDPQVRFDERQWETEPRPRLRRGIKGESRR